MSESKYDELAAPERENQAEEADSALAAPLETPDLDDDTPPEPEEPNERLHRIARGRELGLQEAVSRKEPPAVSEIRARRAMAYAAWVFDGRPLAQAERYKTEFGIAEAPESLKDEKGS